MVLKRKSHSVSAQVSRNSIFRSAPYLVTPLLSCACVVSEQNLWREIILKLHSIISADDKTRVHCWPHLLSQQTKVDFFRNTDLSLCPAAELKGDFLDDKTACDPFLQKQGILACGQGWGANHRRGHRNSTWSTVWFENCPKHSHARWLLEISRFSHYLTQSSY